MELTEAWAQPRDNTWGGESESVSPSTWWSNQARTDSTNCPGARWAGVHSLPSACCVCWDVFVGVTSSWLLMGEDLLLRGRAGGTFSLWQGASLLKDACHGTLSWGFVFFLLHLSVQLATGNAHWQAGEIFLVSGSSLDSIQWAHWAQALCLLNGAHTLVLFSLENPKWERHRWSQTWKQDVA